METYNNNNNNDNTKYEMAKQRVQDLKRFYTNLFIFIVLFIIFNASDFFGNGNFIFGFGKIHFVFLIWGIFLAIRAVKLFIFNSDWEKKQLNKELNDDLKK